MLNKGETSQSSVDVDLEEGEYVYFCPLNGTPQYSLKVVNAEVIKLEETPGQFTTKSLSLEAGKAYNFEVTNKNVDKQVAFVLAPKKDNITQDDWIAAAGLESMLNKGETSRSKENVTLEAGEYVYFCPLNGTPQYDVTVK